MFDHVHQTVVDLKEGLQCTRLRTKEPISSPPQGEGMPPCACGGTISTAADAHISTHRRTHTHTRTVDAHGRLHLYRETATRASLSSASPGAWVLWGNDGANVNIRDYVPNRRMSSLVCLPSWCVCVFTFSPPGVCYSQLTTPAQGHRGAHTIRELKAKAAEKAAC